MEPVASKAYQNEWSPKLLERYDRILHGIAVDEWGYNIYPNQYEIVDSQGMLEAYSSHGMPTYYPHWSHGKSFLSNERKYKRGHMGLAYEMVINANPCISYLMEENTLTMQILVMAHAAFGHNHFFKNNFLFKQWTMADYIIDYLRFAKKYIEDCEEKYGYERVESVIDAAHALQYHGVDKYSKRRKKKDEAEEARKKRLAWEHANASPLSVISQRFTKEEEAEIFDIEPTENILYFIEKNSQILETWEREIVRIVRKMAEYFYPQLHSKVGNEGFATYSHCKLIEELDKRKLVDEAFMLEFCDKHPGVVWQQDMSPMRNPYALGLAIFRDIERIATAPTKEDHEWFPSFAGCKDYWSVIFDAVANYKDESFITQFLSPKVMRDFKMFSIRDDEERNPHHFEISAIHNDDGYRKIRDICAAQHDFNVTFPRIEVIDADFKATRKLELRHYMYNLRPLDRDSIKMVLGHVKRLWGFPVSITSVDENGNAKQHYGTD